MENFIKCHVLIVQQIMFAYVLVTSASKRNGTRLTDEAGVISSPGYPKSYPNDIARIWLINTTQTKYVELTFHDFDVEPYKDCSADYMKIWSKKPTNGRLHDVPPIDDISSKKSRIEFTYKGPYCNQYKPPKVVLSSTNVMAIMFKADSTISRRGFYATYRSLEQKACVEIMHKHQGTIMTPGFPLTYPREGECLWSISVASHLYLRLEFVAFELEVNIQVCMDEIFIWDGKTTSSPLLFRGCRLPTRVMYSSSNHLRIKFISRGYHRKRGFKALYSTTTTKGCGGEFNAENGTLTSPQYNIEAGYTYPAYSNCIWKVMAPKNHVISLKFILFDVMASRDGFCDEDYIQVFDGSDVRTRVIGKYCNIKKPNVITSTENSISMKFVSNARRHGKGFFVQYRRHKTDCTSALGMEDGRILDHRISASSFLRESPHFRPASARLNGPYTWCSQPQVNNQVGEFLQIDLGKSTLVTAVSTQGYTMTGTRQSYFITKYKLMYSNSDGRYFKSYTNASSNNSEYHPMVFQGNSDSVGIIRHNLTHPFVAQMLRIVPLGYLHGRKRTICTKIEVYGCKYNFGDGYLLQPLRGRILYLGKKNTPASNHWIISSSGIYMSSAIYLRPLHFTIDCDKAVLKVSDGVQNYSFCGAKHPPAYQVYSGNGQLKISLENLKGDLQGQYFGFEYFTENLGTGRVLRSARGLVRGSRSYRSIPVRASNVSRSTWIITVPSGQKIVAKFTRMKLGKTNGGHCNEYVEIKDGLLGSSKTFGNFCHGLPRQAVVTTKNIMRVELHTKLHSERSRRDLVSRSMSFEIVYASLPIDANSAAKVLFLSADEPLKQWRKGGADGVHYGGRHWLTTFAVLLVTMRLILLPT